MALKNLAECKPSEFIRQTSKIRRSVGKWIELCGIDKIRAKLPTLETVPLSATAEERADVIRRNAEAERRLMREKINDILAAALDEHPDETLEILALCCFVDPRDVDSHTVGEYLEAFSRLISDAAVMSFFISLVKLGQTDISRG